MIFENDPPCRRRGDIPEIMATFWRSFKSLSVKRVAGEAIFSPRATRWRPFFLACGILFTAFQWFFMMFSCRYQNYDG